MAIQFPWRYCEPPKVYESVAQIQVECEHEVQAGKGGVLFKEIGQWLIISLSSKMGFS